MTHHDNLKTVTDACLRSRGDRFVSGMTRDEYQSYDPTLPDVLLALDNFIRDAARADGVELG